jgi:hypothetical protein
LFSNRVCSQVKSNNGQKKIIVTPEKRTNDSDILLSYSERKKIKWSKLNNQNATQKDPRISNLSYESKREIFKMTSDIQKKIYENDKNELKQ